MITKFSVCTICEKRIAVPFKAMIDGMVLDVCEDCLKYGKRVETTEVDRILGHCSLIDCFWIEA